MAPPQVPLSSREDQPPAALHHVGERELRRVVGDAREIRADVLRAHRQRRARRAPRPRPRPRRRCSLTADRREAGAYRRDRARGVDAGDRSGRRSTRRSVAPATGAPERSVALAARCVACAILAVVSAGRVSAATVMVGAEAAAAGASAAALPPPPQADRTRIAARAKAARSRLMIGGRRRGQPTIIAELHRERGYKRETSPSRER